MGYTYLTMYRLTLPEVRMLVEGQRRRNERDRESFNENVPSRYRQHGVRGADMKALQTVNNRLRGVT